jgi:small-conductance mechanosensitive channel
VTGAIAPLTDVALWARGDLLEIVLLILGAILVTRLAEWIRGRVVAYIDRKARETDELVRSEAAKHRHVVAQVVTWTVLAVVYVITAVLVVLRLGVPLAGLVAPAALLSAALGFGLQRFVQDIGAGLFITGEKQYGFGDVVRIEVTGVSSPAVGTVEDVTLRVTRLRSVSGEVITTPNGQITQVTNLSRDWARAVIDVPAPSTVDVSQVTEILRRVGQEAYDDERLRKMMLDPPTVMGVEKIEVDTYSVRMVARTLPGAQFGVGRELRARVASAFRREGINVHLGAAGDPGDGGLGRPGQYPLVHADHFRHGEPGTLGQPVAHPEPQHAAAGAALSHPDPDSDHDRAGRGWWRAVGGLTVSGGVKTPPVRPKIWPPPNGLRSRPPAGLVRRSGNGAA